MSLSSALSATAQAASDLQAQVDLLATRMSILQSQSQPAQAPTILPSQSGSRQVLNMRDYSAGNGADDTTAFNRALSDAGQPGNPSTVFAPAGVYIVGPLHILYPGTILQGEGRMGQYTEDCRCTILQARDASDSGPMFSFDASMLLVNRQWLRGSCARNIGFDVSRTSRFTTGRPNSPVLSFRAVSNAPKFSDLVVYGNIGTGYKICSSPNVNNGISENLIFEDCWDYAGYLPGGSYTSLPPTDDLVIVSGADNIQWIRGLVGYGYAKGILPSTGTIADPAAFSWASEVELNGTNVSMVDSGAIRGTAITNMPIGVRIKSIDFTPPGQGPISCAPWGMTIDGVTIENFNNGIVIGMEPTLGVAVRGRAMNPRIKGCLFCGTDGWYGTNHHQILADKVQGGQFDVQFLNSDGDVTLGPNAEGVKVSVGPDTFGNGHQFRVLDQTKRSMIDYQ